MEDNKRSGQEKGRANSKGKEQGTGRASCYTQRAGDTPRHAISMTSRTQSED